MKVRYEVLTTIEEDIKYLHASCGVRYWEDSTINGRSDTEEGSFVPCRDGDYWEPVIEIETGTIENWEKGKTASIHYKVCDDGTYGLYNEHRKEIARIENDYVPKIMYPKENGYGDYVIMDVDENGKIKDWKCDKHLLLEFFPQDKCN